MLADDSGIIDRDRAAQRISTIQRQSEIESEISNARYRDQPGCDRHGHARVRSDNSAIRIIGDGISARHRENAHRPRTIRDRLGPEAIIVSDHIISRADTIGDAHGHALDARFAEVLHTVAINVQPDVVTDRSRHLITEIRAGVGGTSKQDDAGICMVTVVIRVAIGVVHGNAVQIRIGGLNGSNWERRSANLDDVSRRRRQAGKLEVTKGIRGVSGDEGAIRDTVVIGIDIKLHNDVLDAGFAVILNAVAVDVVEHRITDRADTAKPEVDGLIAFGCGQVNERADCGQTTSGLDSVVVIVDAIVSDAGGRAGEWVSLQGLARAEVRDRDIHIVTISRDIGKRIESSAAGGGGGNRLVQAGGLRGVVELHGHSVDTGFACVLDAIRVRIHPDQVPNAGGSHRQVTEVHRVQTAGKGDAGTIVNKTVVVLGLDVQRRKIQIILIHHDDVVATEQADKLIETT